MDVEAAAMELLHSCCPAHIPQLYAYDPQQSILAMQCAEPPHQKLLYCIREGQVRWAGAVVGGPGKCGGLGQYSVNHLLSAVSVAGVKVWLAGHSHLSSFAIRQWSTIAAVVHSVI
jgi:hypothetical protein